VPGDDGRPWIIEEYQDYCLANRLPYPIEIRDILTQLTSGLKHLNDHGRMHRNLKPENVLLDLVQNPDESPTRRVLSRIDGSSKSPIMAGWCLLTAL